MEFRFISTEDLEILRERRHREAEEEYNRKLRSDIVICVVHIAIPVIAVLIRFIHWLVTGE